MGCLFKCCEACSTFNEAERLKVFFLSELKNVKKHLILLIMSKIKWANIVACGVHPEARK